ncbi:MAG TPA: FAD-dependent oxidoreductase [Candidatus Dormibacteraeota bacterium]|nr:FAD-dependent oxidoreductase [Candidatus Dormibacteraeota bacterium]
MTEKLLRVTLDGETLQCAPNDPLAVCLYRNGVRGFNAGSKTQRPRGFTNLEWWMPERLQSEQDAFLSPYSRVEREGLTIRSHKTSFSYRLVARMISRFIDSEFPHRSIIRKRPFWDPTSRYLRKNLPNPSPIVVTEVKPKQSVVEADVLVVGSGISGLSFALKLKQLGGKVAVVEGDYVLGGRGSYDESIIHGLSNSTRSYADNLVRTAKDESAHLLSNAVFDGFFEDGALGVELGGLRADAPILFKAKYFVFATGLRDQPSLFGNNDLPGHIVASSALKLTNYYHVKLGRGVVIGNNEYAARTAIQLKRAGSPVTLISGCESLSGVRKSYLTELQEAGVDIITGVKQMRAEGRKEIRRLMADERRLDADFIASAESWFPALEIFGQSSVPVGYCDWIGSMLPMHGWYGETANPSVFVIGRSSGILDEPACSAFAEATACHIANKLNLPVKNEAEGKLDAAKAALNDRYPDNYRAYSNIVTCYERNEVLNEPSKRAVYAADPYTVFVCPCEDVTLHDIHRAVKEHGFGDIELVKRYTGLCTGKCQGKRCQMSGIYAISNLTGKSPTMTGTFRQRPMVITTSVESLEAIEP